MGGACSGGGAEYVADEHVMDDEHQPFMKEPFCIYKGHSADLLDISWSKV